MQEAGIEGEVVVVDNGSTDESASIAAAAGARVVLKRQPGYGSALKEGISAARGDIVVMADSDSTYDLKKIPMMLEPLTKDQADLVVGSRLGPTAREAMPFLHRVLGTPVLSSLVSRACGHTRVHDSQSGFRAFWRDAIVGLGLHSDGMEFASEMLIKASQAGLRIQEREAGYRERIGHSKLNTWRDGLRHLRLILLLAPDLLLIWPGAFLLLLGLVLSITSFVRPEGVEIGSLLWQPVFFSTIATVLGMQALLSGAFLAHRVSLNSPGLCRRFRMVARPNFPGLCIGTGAAAVVVGLTIDLVLFLNWTNGSPSPPTGLAVAALAQTLLILGGSVSTVGVITWLLRGSAAPKNLNHPGSALNAAADPPRSAADDEVGSHASNDGVPIV